MKIQVSGGFAAIVPENVAQGIEVGKEMLADIDIPEQVSKAADMAVDAAKDGVNRDCSISALLANRQCNSRRHMSNLENNIVQYMSYQ